MKWALPVLAAVLLLAAVSTAAARRGYAGITQIRFANAWCESSGNIHAIGWHGIYRGKWQFDRQTWRTYAPRRWKYADPAWAPEWVQDMAAQAVTYDAWPNC